VACLSLHLDGVGVLECMESWRQITVQRTVQIIAVISGELELLIERMT
jgi:hypothetical protein